MANSRDNQNALRCCRLPLPLAPRLRGSVGEGQFTWLAETLSESTCDVSPMIIRSASVEDEDGIWSILEPILREGEAYALPRDWSRDETLAYWRAPGHTVFVAEEGSEILGTYYLRPNQKGGGAHVANCGYATHPRAQGRGVAAAMCVHSLELAKQQGFTAMQFNFVIATNERAVALWKRHGFDVVGRLPGAFKHPRLGLVDALVMHRGL
jgi:ribosomal protein S18 acetylase RimI-like enzyme